MTGNRPYWNIVIPASITFPCTSITGGQEKGTAEFLAQSLDMERYIETVLNICDYVRVKRKCHIRSTSVFDEWGVWSMSDAGAEIGGGCTVADGTRDQRADLYHGGCASVCKVC